MHRSFKETFVDQIWGDKLIIISTILTAVLAYGFTIVNFSIGVDDPAATYYLHSNEFGSMIQQGRLSHVAIEALTGFVTIIPFFNNFLGVSLFVISSWILCGVFQYVTDNAFSNYSLAVFAGVYISFSIINEKFIYDLDVVATMLSYLCFSLSLLYSYQAVFEKNRMACWGAVGTLIISISSFESFPFLYISGAFFLFLIKILRGGGTEKPQY